MSYRDTRCVRKGKNNGNYGANNLLKAITFSQKTYDFLDDDLSGVDWLLKLENLERQKGEAERELRDARVARPASNQQILDLLTETIQEGLPNHHDAERQASLRDIIPVVERVYAADRLSREVKLSKIRPALRDNYLTLYRALLEVDFESLGRVDKSAEADKRIAELEGKVTKIERQIEGHRGNILKCFRGECLPKHFGDSLRDAGTALNAGHPHEQIGEWVLRQFAKDWRQRAPLFIEPVSVHGVSIASMNSDRRKVWTKAYEKMGLEPDPKKAYFQATFEQRQPSPVAQPKGAFFDRSKVSAR